MRLPGRIISGGQTGADRGALDAAIELGLPHGGWCPLGRRAEDGVIPARYAVRETESPGYEARTERNVLDSDATLLVTRGAPGGGSVLTAALAHRHGKPLLHIDLEQIAIDAAVAALRAWVAARGVAVLNVAGPRESGAPGIGESVRRFLIAAFAVAPISTGA